MQDPVMSRHVVFSHGKESGPWGRKISALAEVARSEGYDAHSVDYRGLEEPRILDFGKDPAPLATEALRGEGATLVTRDGHRFVFDDHPDGELAPRDVVAAAVAARLMEDGVRHP